MYRISIITCLFIFTCLNGSAQSPNALNFDGTNDYVQTTFDGIGGNSSRTVEAWIKTPYQANQEVITDWGSMSTGQRFTFNLIAGKIRCEIGGNGVTGTTLVADNTWHHVAVTFNNSSSPKYRMYVDGSLEASFNLTVTINSSTTATDFRIGRRVDNANHFTGSIDEVRVWNYDRTASEISNNMNTEFCTIPSGLVAYHKLNQGVAGGTNTGLTDSPDVSGNANDGTLNGFGLSGSSSNWVNGVSLSTSSVSSSVSITGCDTFISPSGNYVWTQSGTYVDTTQTAAGCDSILTINLTMLSNSYGAISTAACSSYTSPSGNHTWLESGAHLDTIANAAGCDSILLIDLTIQNSTDTFALSGCGQILSPSGNHLWTQSGTYLDTILNAAGCDSLLTVAVEIIPNSSRNISPEACQSYTSPSGNHVWTDSGVYQDTLVNAAGCDSILTITLTIKEIDNGVTQLGYKLTANANAASYQWLDCEDDYAIIPGSLGQSYVSTKDGTFAVRVSKDGCVDTSDCFEINIVGISTATNPSIIIWPNPTSEAVHIQFSSGSVSEVQVMNITGKKHTTVYSPVNNDRIPLPEAPGFYLLRVITNEGSETFPIQRL
ncbi:MAG: T9SS type A sorting domain-containing protein [Flavobacteriales bacterium]|nr:T9SS type A sorting domain-containing protein [Flavobacteriales bacterium]